MLLSATNLKISVSLAKALIWQIITISKIVLINWARTQNYMSSFSGEAGNLQVSKSDICVEKLSTFPSKTVRKYRKTSEKRILIFLRV